MDEKTSRGRHSTVSEVLILSTVVIAVAACAALPNIPHEPRPATAALVAQCESPTDYGVPEFMRISKWLTSAPITSHIRDEVGIQQWPEDSVHIVTDAARCARLDSLIVAWLEGPGAGTLTGVAGTVGLVTVTRIGPTVFHVRPGTSVPLQPVPHFPNFVVDTVAPTRVAYWGSSS